MAATTFMESSSFSSNGLHPLDKLDMDYNNNISSMFDTERIELNKKRKVLEKKLNDIIEYQGQKDITAKVDKEIARLQNILLERPEFIEKKNEEVKKEVEHYENKKEALQESYDKEESAIKDKMQNMLDALEAKYKAEKQAIELRFESMLTKAKTKFEDSLSKIEIKIKSKENKEKSFDDDSYKKYLESEIENRKLERTRLLDKHKTKEQIAIENSIKEVDDRLEKMKADLTVLSFSMGIATQPYVPPSESKEPNKKGLVIQDYVPPWLEEHEAKNKTTENSVHKKTKYDTEPSNKRVRFDEPKEETFMGRYKSGGYIPDKKDNYETPIHFKLLKNYSDEYIETHKRQGLVFTDKEEFERLSLGQQKKCWQLFSIDEIESLRESGYSPSWYKNEEEEECIELEVDEDDDWKSTSSDE